MSNKLIRNPSPDDINKMQFQYQAEAKIEQPKKEIIDNEYKEMPTGIFKEENMFSPPKEKHRLIFKYDIENIEDKNYVYIRRMTAIEEGYFYDLINKDGSSTLDLFNVINTVISNCVRNNIETLELNIVEKLWLFIHILILSYGEEHKMELECEECGKKFETIINFREDINVSFQEEEILPKEYKLTSYPFDITTYIMPPKLKDEDKYISSETIWFDKLILIISHISGTLLNGKEVEQSDYLDIVKNLNKDDINKIKELNDKIISSYGIHLDKINKSICQNRRCDNFEKSVEISIPLDFLFLTVFNNL